LSFDAPKPLIILTADKDAQFAIKELVHRRPDLGIRSIEADVVAHPHHDSGVFKRAHDFLRPFLKWQRALVVFDHDGSGREDEPREAVEEAVEQRLNANGWEGRCRAVVMHPELESCVWDGSYQVNRILDWPGGVRDLERWMEKRDFAAARHGKPGRPKEAFLAALAHRRIQRSSAIYRDLARAYMFTECRDPAFRKLLVTLQAWFPVS
jgi:hypothetical protein